MDHNRPYRPRVSRETRLLLTTALVAVAALWVLARIRFPDLPATPNPVAPLLSQLTLAPTFDGLASEVAQLQARLEPSLMIIDASSPALAGEGTVTRRAAGPAHSRRSRDRLVAAGGAHARQRRTLGGSRRGLGAGRDSHAAGRRPGILAVAVGATRLERPRVPDGDRHANRTDRASAGLRHRPRAGRERRVVRPHLGGSEHRARSSPGSFVFTTAGEFAGHGHRARRRVGPSCPPALVLAEVERLVAAGRARRATSASTCNP